METIEKLNFLSTILPLAACIFIIAIGVVLLNQHFHKNLYRQKLEKEELKNLHQIELLKSSILTQEEERKRIAQDIHDELGATLSITRMHLVQLEQKHAGTNESLSAELQNVRYLIETSLTNMRRISHQLMPPQLETFGLVKTLEAVASQLNETNEIAIVITTIGSLPELNWALKLGLYRMSMELINNTLKHSGGNEILIELSADHKMIVCNYSDNGKGLPDEISYTGMGRKSIEGRAASLGGTIQFSSQSQKGMEVLIILPLEIC